MTRNVASSAELSSRKVASRGVMSVADVRRVIGVGNEIGVEVGLMLRLAALTGARRWELAALLEYQIVVKRHVGSPVRRVSQHSFATRRNADASTYTLMN